MPEASGEENARPTNRCAGIVPINVAGDSPEVAAHHAEVFARLMAELADETVAPPLAEPAPGAVRPHQSGGVAGGRLPR
jgi:hypothetical protein